MTLRVVTLAGNPEREAAIATDLGRRRDVDLILRCVERVELLGTIRGAGLDAIVSVGAPLWLDHQAAAEAAGAGIVIVGVPSSVSDRERLTELGAVLVAHDAPVEDIVTGCRSPGAAAARPRPSTQPSGGRGRIVAVWGPKGAPGRTTIALELGAQLAGAHPDTVLIDGDPYGGDVLQLLGILEEVPTVLWAAQLAATDRLGAEVLVTELRRAGKKGPVVIPGLPRADLWADVSEFGWAQLLGVARAAFRFTVVDTGFCLEGPETSVPGGPGGRNRMARATVAEADVVVAVCRCDPVGMKNFLWAYQELRDLVDPDSVFVLANRVHSTDEREVGDLLRRHTGRRPVAYVPDSPRAIERAVLAGMLLSELEPGSDVVAAVRTVAAAVGGRLPARGVMARLGGARA